MDKEKAKAILAEQLAAYRTESYAALKSRIGDVDAFEVAVPGGESYQIEIQIMWDGKPGGDIRVAGAIDDGGWRAFVPLSDDFIITPDGEFLGE